MLLAPISAVVTGTIVGILGPSLVSSGGQAGHVVHIVLSVGWSWAALAFSVGMLGTSKMQSAGAAVVSLVVAVLAYYLTKANQGHFEKLDISDHTGQTTYFAWGDFWSLTVTWWVFACLLGPILGWAGNASVHGPYRLAARLLVPFVAVVESSMRLSSEAPLQGSLVATTWSVTGAVAATAILVLASQAVLGYRRR
ncbi:hypothetical protein [Streptomyces sp. SID3343]|uniref:hypothetical protein n=1 Tax=Streptomyces sp. SID3343 TaxID=2690260 RepID=UPI00136B4E11|nr:hypothetical protein [Streptomyces sp. SID3343]